MAEHKSHIDTYAERWHQEYESILAEIDRLDTPEDKYSEDFLFLATEIGNSRDYRKGVLHLAALLFVRPCVSSLPLVPSCTRSRTRHVSS